MVKKKYNSKDNTSGKATTFTADAQTARKKVDREVTKERTSPLAQQLAEEFLRESRRDLKAQGHKVEAIEKKYEKKKRHAPAKQGPEVANEPGGGPSTRQHPELPISEGIAPDNVIIPESELSDDAELSSDLKQQYKLKSKLTLKEELKKKKKMKLKQAFKHKHKHRFHPRPPSPI